MDIDHILPKSLGGNEWNHDNLQDYVVTAMRQRHCRITDCFWRIVDSDSIHRITDWIYEPHNKKVRVHVVPNYIHLQVNFSQTIGSKYDET